MKGQRVRLGFRPTAPEAREGILAALRRRWPDALAGLLLVGLFLAIAMLAPRLDRFLPTGMQPRAGYVALGIAAGVVWLGWAFALRRRSTATRSLLLWIGIVGLAMRAALFAAPPILEDDYYRYLWDGAVAASGLNPYRFSPAEAAGLERARDTEPGPTGSGRDDAARGAARSSAADRWAELAREGEPVLERVNHPRLRTVYPPTTQAAFVVAHWIGPWQVWSMRLVLLAFDGATAVLLLGLLGRLGLPRGWIMLYWCNPLLIAQTVGSIHMDVIAMAFVAGALLLTLRHRLVAGATALALAAGAKVWPVMLLPLLLREAVGRGRDTSAPEAMGGDHAGRSTRARRAGVTARSSLAIVVFAAIGAGMAWPILAAGLGPDSGFTAYGGRWDNNAGLFALQREGWRHVLPVFGIHPGHSDNLTRGLTAAVMLGLLGGLTWRPMRSDRALIDRCLIATAALFLLSPTQFPWYFAWLGPLLTLRPVWPLMLYTALLPLYYLQGAWAGVVWLQHAPVLAWLLWMVVRRPRGSADTRSPIWLISRPASR